MTDQERLDQAIERLKEGKDLSGLVLGGERMSERDVPIVLLKKLLNRSVNTLNHHLDRMEIKTFLELNRRCITRGDAVRFLEMWSERMESDAADSSAAISPILSEYKSAIESSSKNKHVKLWLDGEGDFLEVTFSDAAGYMVETEHDGVMARVDDAGNVLGFSVLGVSKLANEKPISIDLHAQTA